MKKLTKITFTITTEEAKNIRKAILFFRAGCTHATAENPDGIMKLKPSNMKTLEISKPELTKLVEFAHWINEEIKDLEAWNAEVDHFEKLSDPVNQSPLPTFAKGDEKPTTNKRNSVTL